MTSTDGKKDFAKSDDTCQKIEDTQDEEVYAYGYQRSPLKSLAIYVGCILTCGLLRLFFHWYPHLYLYATHDKCSLNNATKILVVDDYQGKYKSYRVKEIKIVSTTNIRPDLLSRDFDGVSRKLVDKIRGKEVDVLLENGTRIKVKEYKSFWFKKQCYVWDAKMREFSKLASIEKYSLCMDLHGEKIKGLSREEQLLRQIMYGFNEIVVPVQSFQVLLLLELLNPFYCFQAFSLIVWFCEGYYYYAAAVIAMSACGLTATIRQTRKNQVSLRDTVAQVETVHVQRSNGEFENIPSDELVPGDIIELPRHRSVVSCDAVLLTGVCIVNESMLTGESLPVTKTPLRNQPVLYDPKEHVHHTLFCGTTIIQTKQFGEKPVLAKVIRTGLWTNKGSLIVAILYPPPADFKFDQDSYKLVGILVGIAFVGFFYTLYFMLERGDTAMNIVIKTLTVFTIVVPPALPSVMAVGKMYAIFRLKKREIYCINTRAVNISGSINCVCFDKTGTLTEDGLDMMGVVANENNKLGEPEKDISKLQGTRLFEGMLVCHSLSMINDELSGDLLDIKMFESTGWELYEQQPELKPPDQLRTSQLEPLTYIRPPASRGNDSKDAMEIIQQYQFSSTLQRMSVIARHSDGSFLAFSKGSPEMILSLSDPTTIPGNIMCALKSFTELGYRVIALATKEINVDNEEEIPDIPRDAVEKDLEFLGLIILENRLKEPTVKVIEDLRNANMKIVMITGDNIQTAISVAKDCGILAQDETVISVTAVPSKDKEKPELFYNIQGLPQFEKLKSTTFDDLEFGRCSNSYKFALTGNAWQVLREHYADSETLARICVRGAVFARMSSVQKQQLIVDLMQLGYYVAMCGDGANDCGALRAAHVGISLSEAESSVASPFTSRVPDIRCVPTVIQQGRAALVTSFGIFKFTVCYSLTEFISTIILYSIKSNFSGVQFLYVDIMLFVNFAFFFGKTEAYDKKLAKVPPTSSLVSFTPMFSMAMHTLIVFAFQLLVFYVVQQFSWYEYLVPDDEYLYYCYENYSIFCLSTYQYTLLAIVFSMGKPYRKPIYTNTYFLLSVVLLTILNVYITLYPAQWLTDFIELSMPPVYDWRCIIIILGFINFLVSLGFESFVIDYLIGKKIKSKMDKPETSKKQYVVVEHQLKCNPNWPRISKEFPNLPVTPSCENIINSTRRASMADSVYSVCSANESELRTFGNNGIDNLAFKSDSTDNNEI